MTSPAENSVTSPEKPALQLRNIDTRDPHTERILNLTRETIDRFNYYVEDFFQTREILLEQSELLKSSGSPDKLEENNESLRQVMRRIEEIRISMNSLADQMPELISLEVK